MGHLAAGDGGDHPNLLYAVEPRLQARPAACVLAVEVDVDEAAQLAVLVEQEVGDRQCLEHLAEGRAFHLEIPLPAGLVGDERGNSDYDHSPTSTDRIGGSWRATSSHSSPSFGETKTEPLWVPK